MLTILTFVWTGLTVITSLYNLTTIDEQERSIEILKNTPGANLFGPEFIESAQLALDNIYLLQGTAILVAILCLLGAIMMRNLKKTGFYVYVVASVTSVLVPISVVGLGTMGAFILLGSVFTIAFVIMYGVNVKHLK